MAQAVQHPEAAQLAGVPATAPEAIEPPPQSSGVTLPAIPVYYRVLQCVHVTFTLRLSRKTHVPQVISHCEIWWRMLF
jgi:hypothetical protein